MKSLVDLLCLLLHDVERQVDVVLARDRKTVKARVEHEGESFITLTLPAFARDFERSLADGRLSPGCFPSFGKVASGVPAFLQGLLSQVFDKSGTLRTCPSVDCIRAVRQICLFGKKVETPCTDARASAAADAYVKCDSELVQPDSQLWRCFGVVCDILVDAMPGILEVCKDDLRPKHGPGKTQERISGNQKWRFRRWHSRLETAGFTIRRFARGSATDPHPDEGWVPPVLVEPEDEAPVRVVFVPKTQKAPRVIAIEPVCMQYAQQGLKQLLVGELGKSPYTAGHVNFTDQTVNQRLAKEASWDGRLATLDMSEASDRVALWHAERAFAKAPGFRDLMLACRSQRAELPDGREVDLKKFASMGSALCFPVEAMVFFASIVASRIWRAGRWPTRSLVRSFGRAVYVYGDDLILPADETSVTMEDLEALGFKVNRHKSFWTGKFRESCGSDCYGGYEVTPVYFRRYLPKSHKETDRILSSVATANALYQAGYRMAATAIREAVERVTGKLPNLSSAETRVLHEYTRWKVWRKPGNPTVDSPALGWSWGFNMPRRSRWNVDYQRLEFRSLVPVQDDMPDEISDDAALAKAFLTCGSSFRANPLDDHPATREDHLMVSSRPYALNLKHRWVPAL